MKAAPLEPDGEDITWPDQVAPRCRKASSTRKIKPQTSSLSCSSRSLLSCFLKSSDLAALRCACAPLQQHELFSENDS